MHTTCWTLTHILACISGGYPKHLVAQRSLRRSPLTLIALVIVHAPLFLRTLTTSVRVGALLARTHISYSPPTLGRKMGILSTVVCVCMTSCHSREEDSWRRVEYQEGRRKNDLGKDNLGEGHFPRSKLANHLQKNQ